MNKTNYFILFVYTEVSSYTKNQTELILFVYFKCFIQTLYLTNRW